MEKASIFIDGGYLNKILKEYFKEPGIDYEKLTKNICEKLEIKHLRTYFYHCMPVTRKGNKNDIKKHAKIYYKIEKVTKV